MFSLPDSCLLEVSAALEKRLVTFLSVSVVSVDACLTVTLFVV